MLGILAIDVLVEAHRPCSAMPPQLGIVHLRLALRLLILNAIYSYQPHKQQQAPNKQALSRPIPIPLYT